MREIMDGLPTPMNFDVTLATATIHKVLKDLNFRSDRDLIQATLLECLESWGNYDPSLSAPSTFLTMAARRGIIDTLRGRNHGDLRPQRNYNSESGVVASLQDQVRGPSGDTEDFGDLLPDDDEPVEIKVEAAELLRVLQEALNSPVLDDRERSVVAMYYTRELTQREIGDNLHITESRVNQILREIQRKLRLSLHDWQ